MEDNLNQSVSNTHQKNGRRRFLIGLVLLLLVILLGYSLLSVISSRRMVELYNTKLSQVPVSEQAFNIDSVQPTVAELLNRKAFLSSQLGMMENDSLNLIVDLKDSTLTLTIEGVIMHVSHLTEFSTSRFFKTLTNSAYIQIFSQPLRVESFKSTIVKEPITLKQAPKDTAEAANFFEMPDTLISEFVAVSMKLNNNFVLSLKQEEKLDTLRCTSDRFFFIRSRILKAGNDIRHISRMRIPQSEPEIRISLPKDDLVTIFRALPQSTLISIRLR